MVADAIGQILPFAVGVAISPVPIIGVILMLATPQARSNGPAFIFGWVAGLAIVGTVVLLAASGADASDQGQPADWASVLKLVLGLLLLLVAARQWRGRPRAGQEAPMPKWMQTIDGFTAGKAAGFGVALSAANPKNLLFVIGAATTIAQTGASSGSQAVALAVFIIIATLGTGTPVVLYFALGARSKPILDDLKDWMSHNNAAIMAVLCLVIGAKLIGDAISGLAT
jgi:threonine/homoserine/homoserine lactone efflux protein